METAELKRIREIKDRTYLLTIEELRGEINRRIELDKLVRPAPASDLENIETEFVDLDGDINESVTTAKFSKILEITEGILDEVEKEMLCRGTTHRALCWSLS